MVQRNPTGVTNQIMPLLTKDPCPVCPIPVRDLYAVTHNLLNRTVRYKAKENQDWPGATAKGAEFIDSVERQDPAMWSTPAMNAYLAACQDVVALLRQGYPFKSITNSLEAVLEREAGVQELIDTHFEVRAHWDTKAR